MTTHQTTCWLDRAKEHEFLGVLQCYLESLTRLDLVTSAPVVRCLPAKTDESRVYSYQLTWRGPEAVAQAEAEPRALVFKRRLDLLCRERRVSALPSTGAPLTPGKGPRRPQAETSLSRPA